MQIDFCLEEGSVNRWEEEGERKKKSDSGPNDERRKVEEGANWCHYQSGHNSQNSQVVRLSNSLFATYELKNNQILVCFLVLSANV